MNLIKRLKAVLLKQKPLSDEDIYGIYMEAARHMKPAGLFAVDFARALEARHGIVKNNRHQDEIEAERHAQHG